MNPVTPAQLIRHHRSSLNSFDVSFPACVSESVHTHLVISGLGQTTPPDFLSHRRGDKCASRRCPGSAAIITARSSNEGESPAALIGPETPAGTEGHRVHAAEALLPLRQTLHQLHITAGISLAAALIKATKSNQNRWENNIFNFYFYIWNNLTLLNLFPS